VKRKGRGILAYAIALSAAIHLLVLPLLHPQRISTTVDPPGPIALEPPRRMPTPKPTPRPTPRATPKPHTVTPPHTYARPIVNTPNRDTHTTSRDVGRVVSGDKAGTGTHANGDPSPGPESSESPATSAPLPTPSPAPEPTPTKPACATPNVPAATERVVEPETPQMAQRQGIAGEVTVLVALDARSRLTAARIFKSPSSVLNLAALQSARDTTYHTEVRDCKPVAADYLFVVEFTTQ